MVSRARSPLHRPPARPLAPRHTIDPASYPTHSDVSTRRSPFSFSGTLRATGHFAVIQHNYFSGRSSDLVADGGWRCTRAWIGALYPLPPFPSSPFSHILSHPIARGSYNKASSLGERCIGHQLTRPLGLSCLPTASANHNSMPRRATCIYSTRPLCLRTLLRSELLIRA